MAITLPVSVREKLNGAHEECDRLHAEIATFLKEQPYVVVYEHNPEFTEHSLRLRFTKPFPGARWGRMFGTALDGLRSALDHMIYAIGIQESGQDPPPDFGILQFPVMTNPPDDAMWRVASLSDDVRAAIKAEQPDPNRMEESLLWQLNKLNGTDKHRIIHFTTTRAAIDEVLFETKAGGILSARLHLRALEDEAPFITLRSAQPETQMNMRSSASFLVCVERVDRDGKTQDLLPVSEVLAALERGTAGILGRLATVAGL